MTDTGSTMSSGDNNKADNCTLSFDSQLSLSVLLAHHLQQQPNSTALIDGVESRTWAQSVTRIYQIANGLLALGIDPGDRVAILSRNSAAYCEVFAAIVLIGACAVPLQTMVTEQSLDLMLHDCNARVLFAAQTLADGLGAFLRKQIQLLDGGLLGLDFTDHQFCDFETWLCRQSDSAPQINLNPDSTFNIIYSSGTTDTPKGIIHSHRNRQAIANALVNLGVNKQSVTLISTPLYSNTTIATWWPTLCAGATSVVMAKFDAERALQLIEQYRVTHAMFVPVQYDRIMRLENFDAFDLTSMEVAFSSGAPLRAALKEDIIKRFPGELIEFYGMTEGGVGTVLVGSQALAKGKLGSVGPSLNGGAIKIVDEQGKELSQGEIGEIVGRSNIMSAGYHNREQATRELHWYDSDGVLYFRSGDIGYLDDEGWLYLSDRRKDVIISGGLNIYATDLELVLLEHPDVHEAAVVALPSKAWGETPLAIVVPERDANSDERALLDWANARLGKAQRISQLVFIEQLPRNPIGKILKKDLREAYAHLGDQ